MTHLKAILEKEGRRQRWLAEATGLSEFRVGRIAGGHSRARVEEAIVIARALGRPVEDVFPVDAPEVTA